MSTGVASRLARPNILELHPYRCARDDYSEGILLDANENAFGPPVADNSFVLERYPDPHQLPLKEKYAAYRGHGITPANLFCGVGSDEAIDLLMRIFCRPGHDQILTTPPTYGMYKVSAKVNDVGIVNAPLTPDFDLQVDKVRKEKHGMRGTAHIDLDSRSCHSYCQTHLLVQSWQSNGQGIAVGRHGKSGCGRSRLLCGD
mgnify:CR=1 FL=1